MHFHFYCVVLALAVWSSAAIPEPCTIPAIKHGEVGNYISRKYTKNRSRECFYQLQPGESVDNEDPVILRCEKGYLPAGSPQTSKIRRLKEDVVTCEDGTWSKPLQCEAEITCGEPPPIDFATVTSLFTEDYPLGAIVAYECQPGYVIKGRSATSKCIMSDDGSRAVWTNAPMSCVANTSLSFVSATKISDTTPIPELEIRQNEQECSCTYNYASLDTLAYVGGEKILPGSKIKKGSVVRFTCQHQDMIFTLPTGHRVTGWVNMTCDTCQVWREGDVPSCIPSNEASCDGEPPRIKNGRPLVSKRTHGHVIYYRCDEFAVKVKLGRVECFHGTWRGDAPVCVDARCHTEQLNFPGLVKPDEEFFAHQERFSISCEEGYKVTDGETKISCKRGEWEVLNDPCIKVPPGDSRCHEIDDKDKFIIMYSNEREINSIARYYCKSVSQKIQGSNIRTCQQDGEWSGSDPECIDVTCGEFMVSGSLTVAYSKRNKVGSQAVFRCAPPAVLMGSPTATCRVSGSWSNPRPICDESEVRCPAIDKKGIFTIRYNNDRKVNSIAYYFCNDADKEISGSMSRTCQENGEWSDAEPECVARCHTEELNFPGLVKPDKEFFAHQESFSISCEEGYEVTDGETKISCKRGEWEVINDPCIKVPTRHFSCHEIDDKDEFIIMYSNEREINSIARYYCKSVSQNIDGSDIRICQENGEWSGSDPVCVDVTCGEFMVSGSLKVTYSKGNKVGSQAAFRCAPPAVLMGSVTATCHVNGSWSNPRPICDESEVLCPAIDEKGIFTIRYNNDRKVNSFAYYFCDDEEKEILGSMSRTCQENGEWSGDEPECVESEVLCPAIDEKGIFTIRYNNDRKVNSFAYYFCDDEEKEILGSMSRTCQKNGEWSGDEPECVAPPDDSRCPEIDEKGKFIIKYSHERKINSVARYRCRSLSKKVHGSNIRTCQENGKWSGSDPVCVEVRCPAIDEKGIFTVRYNNDRKVNSFAYYFCDDEEMEISGPNFRTCQENGKWSGVEPECAAPGCPVETLMNSLPPDVVPNDIDITGDFFPTDSELRLICENDMTLLGNGKVKCDKQGRWNLENVRCVAGCVVDFSNSHSSSLIIEPKKDVYRFGDFVVLSCPPRFELTTEVERLMCMGSSGWSDVLPDCQEVIDQ